MNNNNTITLKRESLLLTKKKLNLALNLLISALGLSSLFIKFFLIDGVIAFRAFTVDGNLFTTIVSVIAVVVNIKELINKEEHNSRTIFFLQLVSAVTEAVIFIVVMIGYLPFVSDKPAITPYHMFCLHVAIPILAVLRFIFFEKPVGILKPTSLLTGAIPIGVYAVGVVTAIKLGILPTSFVPYSFLDFEHNFIWYFLFALFAIPAFGYLWSVLFYRLNLRASVLWYNEEDINQLQMRRIKALSDYDAVNSGILIIFCLLAVLLLSLSLMTTSRTSATIQQELMGTLSYMLLDEFDIYLGEGDWQIKDGALYKGDTYISDGTNDADFGTNEGETVLFNGAVYLKASNLVPEMASQYNPDDYVAVRQAKGIGGGLVVQRGAVLNPKIVKAVEDSEYNSWYELVKLERELTKEEEQYKEQLRNTKESYYHYCVTLGGTIGGEGVGIVEIYIPASGLTEQIKNAEYNSDVAMGAIIAIIFVILFLITHMWIKALEKSVDFLGDIAGGDVPEEPIKLGKSIRFSGLEDKLNSLREKNLPLSDSGNNKEQ